MQHETSLEGSLAPDRRTPRYALDHFAIATTDGVALERFLAGPLGGRRDKGGEHSDDCDAFRGGQWLFPGNAKVEVLEAVGGPESRMRRFLRHDVSRIHHVTCFVDDLALATQLARELGFEVAEGRPVAGWREAYLSPRQTFGLLFQLVDAASDYAAVGLLPHWTGFSCEHAAAAAQPSSPVRIVALRLKARSRMAAELLLRDLLGGSLEQREGELCFRWPGTTTEIRVVVNDLSAEGATPWRLVLLEHRRAWLRRSLELASVVAIPWRDVEELTLKGLVSTKLRVRAHAQKGPIAMTMTVPSPLFGWLAPMRGNVDGARRVANVFRGVRALPAPPLLPAAEPSAYASRPPTLRLVPSIRPAVPSSPRSEPIDPDRTAVFKRQGTRLEGRWRLLAVEGRSEGRTISTPFGRDPIGELVYMRDGRMSVMIMAAARAKFGSHGLRAGTGPEKAAAFDSFLAYSGRYERLEDRVIHHPDVASIPDFVGIPEERFVSLEGDRLILSTPPMLEDGRIRTFVIVWQRVDAADRTAPSLSRLHADATMKMFRGPRSQSITPRVRMLSRT